MSDSIAERIDAGWQAARHWETECETARAERDGYLETIRATFRVLDARGEAPDDNAPLEVTVRRVLDYLDKVTTERDALQAQLSALKKRVTDAERVKAMPPWNGDAANYYTPECGVATPGTYALVRLEDGE